MIAVLIIIVALGIILELISLKRDPDKVGLDCNISALFTEPGAAFKVQTEVTNGSIVPVSYLAIWEIYPAVAVIPEDMTFHNRHDGLHIKKVCRLGARQRRKLILETSIKKRGVHLFKGDTLQFGDFLGIREFSKNILLSREIVVYPEKLECPNLTDALGKFCGDVAAKRFLIRDPILTVGTREYTGREPMKEIHWLQSAHRGELMVKEFDYNRQLSVSVLMSVEGCDSWNEETLDECCAVARTVCETLVEAGAALNFFTNARLKRKADKEVWKCEVSFGYTGALLEGLGRATSYSCGTLEKLLEYALHESDFDAAFVVILPEGERRGEEAAYRLRSSTGQEVLVIKADSVY
jgi:hypothetical protein